MKKSLLSICLVVCAAFFGISSVSHAAYTGPDTTYKNHKLIKAKAVEQCADKDKVHLKGKLAMKNDKDLYKFVDNSGSVLVKIKKDIVPTEQFNENTTVEIWGKVSKGLTKKTNIKVERMVISKK